MPLTFDDLLHQIQSLRSSADLKRIRKAYDFACEAHCGQKRLSGEPYIQHPLETVGILMDLKPDEATIIAALLHDVPYDTDIPLKSIEKHFGFDVARLVAANQKLSLVKVKQGHADLESWRRMFLAMAKDLRVVFIRLAERLHNMRTLEALPPQKQMRIARETLSVYAPIASRLGLYIVRSELEDLCFKVLFSKEYQHLSRQVDEYTIRYAGFMESAEKSLEALLEADGIEGKVSGRIKHLYSIYRKMRKNNATALDEIFDFFALRIVLPDKNKSSAPIFDHCYTTIGAIHRRWTPMPGRFKDYIAVPKLNGYRSLHTTVFGLVNTPETRHRPTEIQVRTQSMHQESEQGIASHWFYEDSRRSSINSDNQIMWLHNLKNFYDDLRQQAEDQKVDLKFFEDRIFLLTPQGQVKDLPAGSTPIDFAYSIHSDLGHHCHQAKVNGKIVKLNQPLQNGDVVEIISRNAAQPSRYWFSFVQTNTAKDHLKAWFRKYDREKNIKLGREFLNQALKQLAKPPLGPNYRLLADYGGKPLKFEDREHIVELVGNATMTPNAVIKNIFSEKELIGSAAKDTQKNKVHHPVVKPSLPLNNQVLIQGDGSLPIRLASCCNPTFPRSIRGYVTRGKAIRIHLKICSELNNADPARLLDAQWASEHTGPYEVSVEIQFEDRVGFLRDVTQIIADMNMNIRDTQLISKSKRGRVHGRFVIEIPNYDVLLELLNRLEEIEGALSVKKR